MSLLERYSDKIRGIIPYKGVNSFSINDQFLCEIIIRTEYAISGLRNKDLRRYLNELSPGQISRRLKRLRVHGLIKRIGNTYKYYLTDTDRRVILTALKLKNSSSCLNWQCLLQFNSDFLPVLAPIL